MKVKSKIGTLLLAVTLIFGSKAFASFPVKTQNSKVIVDSNATFTEKNASKKAKAQIEKITKTEKNITKKAGGDNDKVITILLLIFLGFIAAHRWYKKKTSRLEHIIYFNCRWLRYMGNC